MICCASRTGTRRNLEILKAEGFVLLVSRAGEWRTEGFDVIVADCGAWSDHQAARPFDEEEYERFLAWLKQRPCTILWVLLPDRVAGGLASLELSIRWMNRALSDFDRVLIAVQDGMEPEDLRPYVGPRVGIFLGGSTEWKEATMQKWGAFCAEVGCWFHVGRVNTMRRMYLAIAAGAQSTDGSSASRFAKNVSKIARWARQMDLLRPITKLLRAA